MQRVIDSTTDNQRSTIAAVLVALALVAPVGSQRAAAATPTDLFISEYVDGASFNKAIEIFNGTGSPIDLAAGSYAIEVYANGSATPTTTTALTGSVASGDVHVVGNPNATASEIVLADQQSSGINFNGNDAVVLRKAGVALDIIGQIGVDPGLTGWGSGEQITNDRTLVRQSTISAGRTTNDAFDPATEWNVFAFDTTAFLGSHTFDGGTSGSSSGTVNADVTMAAAAACLELSATSISFGTLGFGAEDVPASPSLTLTNCATVPGTLFASATDAVGTTANWALVDSAATCADTLGTDAYRLNLQSPDLAGPLGLGTNSKSVQSLAAGAGTTHTAHIYTPCPGSSGDGETLTFEINYLVTE